MLTETDRRVALKIFGAAAATAGADIARECRQCGRHRDVRQFRSYEFRSL